MNSINPKGKTIMKTTILISAFAACALSTPMAFAQANTAAAKPAMSMNDKQTPAVDENMKKMQLQMEKIGTTTDPKERQKLMQEHMKTMQENMKAMRAMGGPMSMDDKKNGGMMGGKKGGMKDGDMKDRQEMTEKRMDMMQMMMEQMMKRDQAMQPMPHM